MSVVVVVVELEVVVMVGADVRMYLPKRGWSNEQTKKCIQKYDIFTKLIYKYNKKYIVEIKTLDLLNLDSF